jgi:hypothetical protein
MLRAALPSAARVRQAILWTRPTTVLVHRISDCAGARALSGRPATDGVWKTLERAALSTDHDDDHVGLLCRHQVFGWTYTELYKRVLGVALALRSLGLDRQDRVLVCVKGNDSEKLLVHLGGPLAGLDVVSVSDPSLLHEVQQAMGCKALVISPQNFLFFDDVADLPQTFQHPPILTGPVNLPPNDSGRPPVVHSFVELVTEIATAPVEELEQISALLFGVDAEDDADDAVFDASEPHFHFACHQGVAGDLGMRSASEKELMRQGKAVMNALGTGANDRVLVGSELATPFGTACVFGAVASCATIVLTNIQSATEPAAPIFVAQEREDVTVLSTLHDSKCTLLCTDQQRVHKISLPLPKIHDISSLRGGVVNCDVASDQAISYAGIPLTSTTIV